MMKQMLSKLTYANVMATIAVFVALGGVGYAATRLPRNSVGTKQIRKAAVTPAKLNKAAKRALQGPAGPEGPRGGEGPRGPAGQQGQRGPQGATGAAGGRGAQGEKGEKGERGDRGEKGEPGERGPSGEPGSARAWASVDAEARLIATKGFASATWQPADEDYCVQLEAAIDATESAPVVTPHAGFNQRRFAVVEPGCGIDGYYVTVFDASSAGIPTRTKSPFSILVP
jgi:hypothetical protein